MCEQFEEQRWFPQETFLMIIVWLMCDYCVSVILDETKERAASQILDTISLLS